MLYNTKLEELVFNKHLSIDADELIIISGYLGPAPVQRLSTLPFPTKVVYGMYASDKIGTNLHNALLGIQNNNQNIDIFYSTFPVHSKCYVWKKEGQIILALIGSANFSANGLKTPYREILAEANSNTLDPLDTYLDMILNKAALCTTITASTSTRSAGNRVLNQAATYNPNYCTMTLLDPRTDETQNANGLNWGQNNANHTNTRDSNIPIRADHIRNYPQLFPPKLSSPSTTTGGREQRHNDAIEILWDDGTIMEGLLEGNRKIDDIMHPKQISSFPNKSTMGDYLRGRLGLAPGVRVEASDLLTYGRTDINVSLISEGIYSFDFSI